MITVTIPLHVRQRLENSVNYGLYCIKELREAGVPVIGVLWPEGVERGSLCMRIDEVYEDRVYEWRES